MCVVNTPEVNNPCTHVRLRNGDRKYGRILSVIRAGRRTGSTGPPFTGRIATPSFIVVQGRHWVREEDFEEAMKFGEAKGNHLCLYIMTRPLSQTDHEPKP
ncbi:hypothetical protein CBL_01873 [Carabus blaptoides fortunei]